MKKLLIACSLALATTSCATIPGMGSTSNAQCATQFVMDDKAMAAAELAYNVPAQAYISLNRAGKLSAETKAKVKPLLIKSFEKLDKLYTFYKLQDGVNFSCALSELNMYSSSAKSLLGVN